MRAEDASLDPDARTLDATEPGSETERVSIPAAATAGPAAPERLGRYTLLGVLGRGGMGVVHEALDEQVGRKVAIKLLHAELRGRKAERLVREARALARLSHPNVVQVYEMGRYGERWFIAMELVDGRTLRDWQRERPPWRECVRAYVEAGRGLAAAHAAGVIHRDFKPGNCIVDDRGRVRVLDFGVARQAGEGSDDASPGAIPIASGEPVEGALTRTGEVLGTLAYMPLEQLEGKRADARSDQWSFCASLYEALYHERPFVAESVGALMLALMGDEARPAPTGSRVPRRLRRALLRGLAKDPTARWPSMEALLAELVAIARARRARGLLAAGGVLVAALAGLGPRLFLPAVATVAAPVDAASSPAATEDDGRAPSPAAVELRAHAEELHAARRTRALREHLERIAPGESPPDDPTLAAEVLLWRGRTAGDQDVEAALLRRAHGLARDSDVPSIESRVAGAMTGNMHGAHAEGVDEWLRLAWVAVQRTPWDRRAAVEVAVTAAHSVALTRELDPGMSHARDVLEFADAVVGEVEPDDDAFIALQLVRLADGWLTIEEVERGLHWAFAARSLLAAVADATHPLWPETSELVGRGLRLRERHDRCQEASAYFDEALRGFLRLGDDEHATLVRLKLARCLWRLGRHEAGLEVARRATEHWATHEPTFHADQQAAHLLTGDLLVGLGRIDEARAEYERILTLVDVDTSTQLVRQQAKRALERLGPPADRRVKAR